MNSLRCCFLCCLVFASARLRAQTDSEAFLNLSLEELSQIQITSIARKHGSLFDTSAAVFVLTGEDLHRSGATDLAEALRAVPGFQVGQIDPVNFAIGSRGFNDSTSSKLLVLMDGRSLYSQTQSGAYWNYHELFLEDVDRLETIRGPGAALWGANAMNGVINIVSKSAFSTLGTLATSSFGDQLKALVGVRYGWQPTKSTAVRVYARYRDDADYGEFKVLGVNGWSSQLAGARFDWRRPGGGGLTLITEGRNQLVDAVSTMPILTAPYGIPRPETRARRGGHLLGRWRQPIFGSGELTAQASYERMTAHDRNSGERHHIVDSDLQLSLHPAPTHDLLAGVSLRRDEDDLAGTPFIYYRTPSATTTFIGAFVQDEITVVPNRLSVTVGTKLERNTFTGWEFQPDIRTLYRVSKTQRLWAAISRAARTPSRAEREVTWFPVVLPPTDTAPLPTKMVATGSDRFDSEHVTAFELGHRIKLPGQVTFDTALYHNSYRDVRGLQPSVVPFVPTPAPHTLLTLTGVNRLEGSSYGGEMLMQWRPHDTLLLEGSVAAVRYDLREREPTIIPDPTMEGLVGSSPHQEYKLRALWDFHENWSLDLSARRSDAMPYHGIGRYFSMDAHLGWRPRHDLEVELVGRNLLDPHHTEAPSFFLRGPVRELPRSVFVRVTYRR